MNAAPIDAARLIRVATKQWLRGPLAGLLALAVCLPVLAFAAVRIVPSPSLALATGLAALASFASTRGPMRVTLATLRHGWLAPLPITATTRWLTAAFPCLTGAALVGALVAVAVHPAWPFEVAVALAAGSIAGAALAVTWPVARGATAYPQSRYRLSAPSADPDPDLGPVVVDLHSAVAARLQPSTLARVAAPALVLLPTGLSSLQALQCLAALVAVIYGTALFTALGPFVEGTQRWTSALPLHRPHLAGRLQRSVRVRLAWIALGIAPILFAALDPIGAVMAIAVSVGLLDRIAAFRTRRIGRPG
ncbi:MAG: hypothetical protein R3323_08525 [Wenzhouxiangellaceae bacterium]|nr:hypothetical protein [Wenzhouxiangellaceae bacterium]